MAIDFPASPTPGQVFQGYYWDNVKKAWRSETPSTGAVVTSTTTPTGAKNGDLWYNTNDGTLYVYFDNGITAYWTEIKANSALTTTLNATKANLAGGNTFTGTQVLSTPLAVSSGGTGAATAAAARAALGAAQQTANWVVSNAVQISVATTTPTVICSVVMTTNGRPVFLNATGDMNPTTAPANWNYLQLYRDNTALGKVIICESTANSVNNPWALTMIDNVGAGTYTYSVKANQGAGIQQYGETGNNQAPQLIAFELF